MRTIMLLNPKGGCGKSTLATNLASYYASQGNKVTLADLDPQGSSLDWLAARPETLPEIRGIAAWNEPLRVPKSCDVVIMDAPAATHGKALTAVMRRTETLLMPVLPSPMDMRAVAKFIEELLATGRVKRDQTRNGVVANRVREHTRIFHELEKFLKHLKVPFVGTLRDTQNYIRAASSGAGIFEMAPSMVQQDVEQWQTVLKWLRSKRSYPSA